jgi:hypothetical protein
MARNEHKRQQKLMKKQRRANTIKKERNKSLNVSNRELVLSAAKAPWVACYQHGGKGLFNLYAIRQTRRGTVASIFLVDSYCLGIKDSAFIKDFDLETFRQRVSDQEMETVTPAAMLKFVEDAVKYARSLGFEPHADFEVSKLIFGDTNSSECTQEFEFGKDGIPHYISGPRDSRDKQVRILKELEKLGEGNYLFTLLGEESSDLVGRLMGGDLDDTDDEYDDEDDEYDDDEEFDDDESLDDSETINALEVKPAN